MQNFTEFSLDEARMSAALRMANAIDKQRAKSDASRARTPSSIPKKEEPKKQGVAEGSGESYIIVRTDSEGKKDVFAGNFDTYERAQKELDGLLAHPLHTKYKQKFEIKRKGGEQGVAESSIAKYKDIGATNRTTHFIKNITTGKIVSPHRSLKDAEDSLVGSMHNSNDKFKIVRAVKEELELVEALDTHEMAMAHKDKASKALETSDMKSYHSHMSNHHESMGQWHESKGRHSAADREYAKGEEHHEKSLKPDNSRTVGAKNEEVVAEASDRMQRYGQLILKRKAEQNAAAQAAKPQPKKEEPPASSDYDSMSTRDFMKQLRDQRRPKKKGVAESAICIHCQSDPYICDDSHGFVSEAAQGHTIEAHGIRGMKRTAWRKTFKSHEHLAKWADANDSIEVHATRDLEQAKKGNLSPAMKEETQAMHRVGVTVSEKDHPMVSKRLEKQQKFVKVSAGSKEEAVTKAKKFYSKQGYHVHGAEHHSMSEEVTLQEDDIHAVHVNGRQWKTFSTKSHAENVAKKIKGATVHKYDSEKIQNQYNAKLSARNAARGKEWDESTIPSFKEFVEDSSLDKFKKYTRPVVKTTPKMEKTTNPAGRTTDHTEWKVTTHTGEVHRHNSKKEAQAHFDSLPK